MGTPKTATNVVTGLTSSTYEYFWRIENFDVLMKSNSMINAQHMTLGETWKLQLSTGPNNSKDLSWIGIYLHLKDQRSDITGTWMYKVRIAVKDKLGKAIFDGEILKQFCDFQGYGHGFAEVINKDSYSDSQLFVHVTLTQYSEMTQ